MNDRELPNRKDWDDVEQGWNREFLRETEKSNHDARTTTRSGWTPGLEIRINQAAWTHPTLTRDQIREARDEARKLYERLHPNDVEEEVICLQIVMWQCASLGAMRLANELLAEFPAAKAFFEMSLKASDRCMRYQSQLDRRRGRLDQRVVVQRVNVEQGGQAIVGAITTNNSRSLAAPTANDPATYRPPGIKFSTRPPEQEVAANDAVVPLEPTPRKRRPV